MTFNKVVFDIETTMTADKIWCIVCKHGDTYYQFKEDRLHRFAELIKQTEEVIGHNIIGFDIPVVNTIFGYDVFANCKVTDTLVLSRLLNPMIEGGHSLKNWGTKLGQNKIHFEQFDYFSEDMLTYCRNDVELTERLYKFLINKTINHGTRYSYLISSIYGLGNTEGEFYVGDKNKCLKFSNSNSMSYLIPTLKFEEVDNSYLLRLTYSAQEIDDTFKKNDQEQTIESQITISLLS